MAGVLLLIALSTPLALAVETVVRQWMMPPEFEEIRAWLCATLAPWAWAMVPTTVLATVFGWWLLGVLRRRALRTMEDGADGTRAAERAELEAIILSSTAPQIPALIATFLFMMGAPLLPVAVAMATATAGVLSLALWIRDPSSGHSSS